MDAKKTVEISKALTHSRRFSLFICAEDWLEKFHILFLE